jgi:hypothetical protein
MTELLSALALSVVVGLLCGIGLAQQSGSFRRNSSGR